MIEILQNTRQVRVLTKDQEYRLFDARKKGISLRMALMSFVFDDEFRERWECVSSIDDLLVRANEGLVARTAIHYGNPNIDIEDRKQEGKIGLFKAIERFDHTRGYKFSTYATWWIRQKISISYNTETQGVYIPRHQSLRNSWVLSATDDLTDIDDITGIATQTKLTAAQVKFTLALLSSGILNSSSLDTPTSEHSDILVRQTVSISDEDEHDRLFLEDLFESMFKFLSPRERKVLNLRYGLSEDEPKSSRRVARELKTTVWKISTTEKEALEKLRRFLKEQDSI